jgi:triosephosphate isomerase
VLNQAKFDQNNVEVVVAPIALHLLSVKAKVNDSIKIASQDMSKTGNGAFTGEVSASALKDLGIEWVIIGHSERRV